MRRFLIHLLVLYVAMASASTLGDTVSYKVKKGDTLSRVLRHHGIRPLYGESGFIKLTIKLNEGKIRKNGNFVRIGEIIQLQLSKESDKKVATISPTQQETALEKKAEIEIKSDIIADEEIKRFRAPSDEFPYSRFVYSPHLAFLRVDSTNDVKFGGSSVTALSKRGVGLDLAWHIFYDDRFSFFGFGSLDYFSFYNDPNYSLNNSSITHLHFGAGGSLNHSPDLKFTSRASLREVSFLDIRSPTTVSLESISVPEIEMGFEKTVFIKKQLKGIWGAHLSGLLPSSRGSYKSKWGHGLGSSFEVIHQEKALFLDYDLRSLSVNEIKNKEQSIVFGMRFFGENVL
ncbi:MAG: hypothetical protein ACXVLQ_17150 [Bacteriovorax sp.]